MSANGPSVGLPAGVQACLFDLDGVLTDTAAVHARAWKEAFDAFLRSRPEPFVPFDIRTDYSAHVDGLPRLEGVRKFLASRGIELPEGAEDDSSSDTVTGIGNRKNDRVLALLETEGVEVFPASVTFLKAARAAGLRTAVVSSSANTKKVLDVTGLAPLIDVRVDALVAEEKGLRGKPAPDTFLHAAQLLEVEREHAAVFEDALAGVEAGAAGGFATVVGVDRADQRDALIASGADVVVDELDELLPGS
jgi:beta-phosphoglucomutase family hydrolase